MLYGIRISQYLEIPHNTLIAQNRLRGPALSARALSYAPPT